MPPVQPVEPTSVILIALFNPAVIVVAFWLGRNADQLQKVPIAAFAAALAGSVLVYIAVRWFGLPQPAVGRAAAGIFTAEFVFGLVWAYIGRRFFPRSQAPS